MRWVWGLLVVLVLSRPLGAREMTDGWVFTPEWERACVYGEEHDTGRLRISCGTGRLFGMPELPLHSLSGRAARSTLFLEVDLQTLGSDVWREQRLGAELGWGHRQGVGLIWVLRRIETAYGEAWSRQEMIVTLRIASGKTWSAILYSDPLSLSQDRPVSYRSRWLVLRGRRSGLAWALTVDRRRGEAPESRAALMSRVAPDVAFGISGEPGTGTIGLTTTWFRGGLCVRTSHLVHPALGISHRWMLVLGGGTP